MISVWQSNHDGNSMAHLLKSSFSVIIVLTTSIIKQLEKNGYKLILDLTIGLAIQTADVQELQRLLGLQYCLPGPLAYYDSRHSGRFSLLDTHQKSWLCPREVSIMMY
jgi:hypothetical protein